jgi:diphthamide synthase (EF-2-diphthine--ammonia ligase)
METLPQREPVLVSWSGGKDSCMALREVVRNPNLRVEALLTTIACDYDRVSMHGVRRASLERQADSLGIPLHRIPISKNATTLDGSRRAMGPKNTIRSISCGQRPGELAGDDGSPGMRDQ